MKTLGSQTAKSDALERVSPAQEIELDADVWTFDSLSDEDRASIERGLAQSLAGIHSTDEEVEAAFAAFRR